ncbi:hypothetical protein N0V88_004249 [Collariella sp. IMI 366227]|nr:hypothetical protein N0V88_004249 [Collariella sp. IMI 366227]
MSPKRIRVREATPADVDAIAAINFSAFDDNVMNHLMYPGGPSESTRNKFAARILQQITAKGAPITAKAGEVLIAVAEYLPEGVPSDGPSEVVAFARWLLHREPLTEEEWNVDDVKATTETWGEGVNVDVVNTFIGGINRKQRDHAKGEAALSSPAGYPLYRRFGYEDVDVSDLKVTELWGRANTDGSDWGANNAIALTGGPASEGVVRSVIMRRPPKP